MAEQNGSVLKPLHLRSSHKFSDLEWGLSVVFGAIGLITIGLALLVFVISISPTVKKAVAPLIPRGVEDWFEQPSSITAKKTDQVVPAEISELAKRIAAEPKHQTVSVPQTFTKQSSKSDVIRIHGVPTRVDGDVWYYGASEVHFSGDRVTSWRSSPEFPLRAR
jgi:hypothetical protein